jgi:hypothetical protein
MAMAMPRMARKAITTAATHLAAHSGHHHKWQLRTMDPPTGKPVLLELKAGGQQDGNVACEG